MEKSVLAGLLALILCASAIAQQRVQVDIPATDGRTLTGVLFLPESGTPAPGVIVLHTAYGSVESFDEDYARALARQGFVALAPNYIHSSLGERLWAPAITADMAAIVDFLRQRPEAKGMPVGTVGFSLGSRGLLLAARHPEVKAVVVYYGTFDVRKEKGLKLGPTAMVPMMVAGQVNAPVLLLHGDADDEIPIARARMEDAKEKGSLTRIESKPCDCI